jgi:hypothetical protein
MGLQFLYIAECDLVDAGLFEGGHQFFCRRPAWDRWNRRLRWESREVRQMRERRDKFGGVWSGFFLHNLHRFEELLCLFGGDLALCDHIQNH